ncbi:MAG: NAD-binding protein, partial [Candidatus Methylomirabilota bacterium]
APATRAPKDAEAGRLNSLVGASPELFARIRPLLETYSESVFHFGPVGAGHTAKLVNNFITMGYCALIAEGMAVCASAGVDMRAMYQVMSRGAADSGALRKMIPAFLEGDLTGHQFAIANALKDVTCARAMMEASGFDSLLAEAVQRTYAQAVEQGFGDRLMASLMEMHEARIGRPVVPRSGR